MKRRMYIYEVTACLLAAFLLSACEHKELCFDHDSHALKSEVRIEAQYETEWQYTHEGGTDWKSSTSWGAFGMAYDALRPGIPEGLRVQVYSGDGTNSISNLAPGGGIVPMSPGGYSLLLYNNDTEYIVFDQLASYASARATTRSCTRSSYKGNPYMEGDGENTVNQPDMLYGSYVESYAAERKAQADLLPVTMRPLVFTYLVRCEFSHGLEYVALARGALAGMAGAVWLNSGRTSENAATVLFDCTVETFGAQATVRSFGVPGFSDGHYTSKAQRRYALNLEVRLRNGNILSFDFDVTAQVASQPQGGVITVTGIEIPDEEGGGGGSGFDVNVDDWGEFEDIELPI